MSHIIIDTTEQLGPDLLKHYQNNVKERLHNFSDRQDYLKLIFKLLLFERHPSKELGKEAYNAFDNMDTAIRDEVPIDVVLFLEQFS